MSICTIQSKQKYALDSSWSLAIKRDSVSDRELEVLCFIARGDTSSEIARLLFISEHTVLSHRKNLLVKLDARNSAHLVMKAIKIGLL